MTKLEQIKNILYQKNASLIVCFKNGQIKEYYQDGIKDIKIILQENENSLKEAIIADKVIGKVAASILIVAGVKEIYADVISSFAIDILQNNNIKYNYNKKVDYIINKMKTGMCPMENKYKDETNINNIYNEIIKQ